MGLHDYGLHCERCGARLELSESAMGGLCSRCRDEVTEELALLDDEKRPPERGNAQRYNDNPSSGMVRDDLGRWVKWDTYFAHVNWLAKQLQEATGTQRGIWLDRMRKDA